MIANLPYTKFLRTDSRWSSSMIGLTTDLWSNDLC